MKTLLKWSAFVLTFIVFSCTKEQFSDQVENSQPAKESNSLRVLGPVSENFNTGTKTAYAIGNVALASGSWSFDDALIGNSTSDVKNGAQSARVRNLGRLTMNFDKEDGAGTVSISHAKYGTDGNSDWQLWYSTNGGTSYVQAGATVTTSTTTLQVATFPINVAGLVRFQIRKSTANTFRINFDDFAISNFVGSNPAPLMGSINPTSTTAGGPAFNITVTGSNFVNTSVVKWNTTNLTTTYVSATQLTASVPAALISAAGTAQITVFTGTPGGGTSSAQTFTINAAPVSTAKKFLFDNKHAQTAGNADWVIDQDNNIAQRYPTPLQSTVTSSTAGTYWNGAISSWAIALVKSGHQVETLPTTGSITYGNASNAQDLSNYDVFVVVEPNKVFTAAEKTAILTYIQNGGGLILGSNHFGSDRDNDGWDAPRIWNDLMTNNSVQTNPFGLSFDLVSISGSTTNIAPLSSSPILGGIKGNVTSVEFNSGGLMTLNPTANSTVTGLVWQSGSSQGNSNVMAASVLYGNGRVFAICDSSPSDDGTGAAGNTLFNGWSVFSHTQLFMNASLWCADVQ